MSAHVVILGGGFGGLAAAKALKDAPVRVTLIDRKNHHLFQPLLYQVATAALSPADIAYPIRSVLRKQRNATVLLAEAIAIDKQAKKVVLVDGELTYDYLIVATGATHSYFGKDEWEAFAPGLKTLEDATNIRRRILFAFEAAERETHPERRKAWLTFVVVGGGPTGVEMAGAIAEVAQKTVALDFRHIDPTQSRVILLEGGARIASAYAPELSKSAERQLEELGVEVRLNARVTQIDEAGVGLAPGPQPHAREANEAGEASDASEGERILARTVVWGAGVKASPLGLALGVPVDRLGRVEVSPDLSIPGHPEVFVAGDLAATFENGRPVPGVAPAAMQMGRHAADCIDRLVHDETPRPFHYRDKGSLATIGRSAAIAQLPGGIKLSGFLAWAAWLLIHVFFLIGFRNRVLVLMEWAWSYVTFQRGARLIVESAPPDRTR